MKIIKGDVPVYEQIVMQIKQQIQTGDLAAGQRLKTVRELSDELMVARGTVKHAYDELEKLGLIEMVRGRGTFVCNQESPAGKKDRAMAAIDQLLGDLEDLSFSQREIEMILNLKLREREERQAGTRLLLIDCNVESLSLLGHRMAGIPQVSIETMLLQDLPKAISGFDQPFDLVVTTATHYSEVRMAMSTPGKLVQIVLSPTRQTVMDLVKVGECETVGILSKSEILARLIGEFMRECGIITSPQVLHFGKGDLAAFLQDKDAVIVPQEYLLYADTRETEVLADFASKGKPLVRFDYSIDAGSFLRMQERIEELQKAKM